MLQTRFRTAIAVTVATAAVLGSAASADARPKKLDPTKACISGQTATVTNTTTDEDGNSVSNETHYVCKSGRWVRVRPPQA